MSNLFCNSVRIDTLVYAGGDIGHTSFVRTLYDNAHSLTAVFKYALYGVICFNRLINHGEYKFDFDLFIFLVQQTDISERYGVS